MFDSNQLLLAFFWILYCSSHSILASVWFKAGMQRLMGNYFSYYRLLYSCFAAVLLMALLVFQFSYPGEALFEPGWQVLALGAAGTLAGLAIMIICIKKYFLNLSGVDVLLKKQITPVLEKGGLHAYMRHPLYSGTLLFIWALFFIFPYSGNLLACIIITIYTLIGIRMEEKKLVIEFGEAYKAYAHQTPMLIPTFRGQKQ